jgi:hypothetical protein
MSHRYVYFVSQIPNSNSSSTHYLVKPNIFSGDPDGYGWGVGVVRNRHIGHYMFSQAQGFSPEMRKKFMERYPWAAEMEPEDIDHQSQIDCYAPTKKDGTADEDFVFRLMDAILESDAEILISNDNGGESPEEDQEHPLSELFHMLSGMGRSVVHENTKDAVVVSNGYRKTVIKFKQDAKVLPYLCDIKITDYCERECPWCYQNSSKKGKHASIESIQAFIKKYPHVVEVALGGGEATLHPQFDKIVNMLAGSGIAVNLTTRNIKWFDHPKTRSLNAIAISVDSVAMLRDGLKQASYAVEMCRTGNTTPHGAIHLIAWPKEIIALAGVNLSAMVRECAPASVRHVVLLDPKMTNAESALRYKKELQEVGQEAVDKAMKHIVEGNDHWNIAIDTPLVKRYKDMLDFNEMYMREEDGELSFYYDAVEEKEYKSSYEKGVEYHVQER